MYVPVHAVCEITACQRTFSRQKRCLSGHTDICMDKTSGQGFSKLNLKLMISFVIARILALCPDNSISACPYNALTVCQPVFQKLFRTLYMHTHLRVRMLSSVFM